MVRIDGSQGEGGGQILRSALTLSLLTREPVRIEHIRAGRRPPGLRPQHLQALRAAAEVGQARTEGAVPGSTQILFQPERIRPGSYRFDIGTAGSATLVLQTVLIPLLFANASSSVTITGGTHVPWSPPFHFLSLQWIPFLRQIGCVVDLEMDRAGFYPTGGGRILSRIEPGGNLRPLSIPERGALKRIHCVSLVANLPSDIADRQGRQAFRRLESLGVRINVEKVAVPSPGKGTMLLLLGEFEHSRCCYTALGERGKPAERVADEAAEAFLAFLASNASVDEFVADQLLLPLSLAKGTSVLSVRRITGHLRTNAEVIRAFLPVDIELEKRSGDSALVTIRGKPG